MSVALLSFQTAAQTIEYSTEEVDTFEQQQFATAYDHIFRTKIPTRLLLKINLLDVLPDNTAFNRFGSKELEIEAAWMLCWNIVWVPLIPFP